VNPDNQLQEIPEWKQYLRLGEKLLDQATVEQQCQTIKDTIKELLGAESTVWLSEPYFPIPGEIFTNILPHATTSKWVQNAYHQQLTIFNQGENKTAIIQDHPSRPRILAIPMVSQDNMFGILEINRKDSRPFDHREINFLEGLAGHAAISLQVVRIVSINNWQMEQLSLVRLVSEQIANVHDLAELCSRITHLIQNTFDYYYVAIFLINGKTRTLELKADYGATEYAKLPGDFNAPIGEGIIGFVGKNGKERVAPDVKNDPYYKELFQLPETISEAAFPLKIGRKTLGVLDIQSDLPDAFQENDRSVLRALADSIALAVQDADLYNSVQRRAQQISTIFEVSHAINSLLNLDELLQKVIQIIKKQFGFDYIHVFTVHPGRRKIFYQAGTGEESKILLQEALTIDMDSSDEILAWVAKNGISAMTNDIDIDKRFSRSTLPPYDNLSELIIPLQYGQDILGLLDIQSTRKDAFDENDLFLFEALGATISSALRNAILYQSEQWRRQVADSFKDVIGQISSNTALDQLLQNILSQLDRNLPCDAAAIWLLDMHASTTLTFSKINLSLAATTGISKEKLQTAFLAENHSWELMEAALNSAQPTIRKINGVCDPLGMALNFPDDYSAIAAPLKIGDQVLGLLTLAHQTSRRYGTEARDMTATFANYAAVAIQNARLYADSQEQAWMSTVLLQVAQSCQSSDNIEDLLDSMVRLTPLLVGIRKCAFYIWDSYENFLFLKSEYGFHSQLNPILPLDIPAVYQLKHTQNSIFIQNTHEELLFENLEISEETGTLVLLPLSVRGELLGAFLVAHEDSSGHNLQKRFSTQTLSILQGISQQTAISLDNLRLVEARQEEAYITAVLLQVAQTVVSQNNLDETFDSIVNLLPILIGVNACAIFIPKAKNEETFQAAAAYADHFSQLSQIKSQKFGEQCLLLKFVARSNQIAFVYMDQNSDDLDSFSNATPQPYIEGNPIKVQPHMAIAYPISMKGELLGILYTKEDDLAAQYFLKRVELLNGVTQEIALAIQNHELQQDMVLRQKLEQEIHLARQIQKTFLPDSIPYYSGWEIVTRWETALQVGGDFYDLIPLSKHRLGIVIADVADKGLAAALYMTVSRTLIRAFGQTISDPGGILSAVNQVLVVDTPSDMFVTAVFAIIDMHTGTMIYANAGHNLPFLYHSDKKHIEELPKGNMALGVMEDIVYQNHEVKINPGEMLLLYTDGLTESFGKDGEIFGVDRVKETLNTLISNNVREMFSCLDMELQEFRAGTPASDDLTLIGIQRLI
jgi:serine phosphatase RsbU (regulator of sigma subunit)/putative methionine-R-sulfoxide reductase with GAF domain